MQRSVSHGPLNLIATNWIISWHGPELGISCYLSRKQMCTFVGMTCHDMLNIGTLPWSKKRAAFLKQISGVCVLEEQAAETGTSVSCAAVCSSGLQTLAVINTVLLGQEHKVLRGPGTQEITAVGCVIHHGSCKTTTLSSHRSCVGKHKLKMPSLLLKWWLAFAMLVTSPGKAWLDIFCSWAKTPKPKSPGCNSATAHLQVVSLNFSACVSSTLPHICPKGWMFNIAMGFWKHSVLNPILKYLTVKQIELILLLCKANVICIEFLASSANKMLLWWFCGVFFPFLWSQGCRGGSWTQ